MSKDMDSKELIQHCEEAAASIQKMLNDFSQTGERKFTKRAMLIAYWIKTYVRYLRQEDAFAPESVFRLKRGSIIRVEFGYKVGRELGGRHYAVVLDEDNALHRNTVTVVPLGSLKETSKPDRYTAVLEAGIYEPVKDKILALCQAAEKAIDEAMAKDPEINSADAKEKAILKAVQRQHIEDAKKLMAQARDWVSEIEHMKPGSVARVDQITTISKMRISQPLQKTHPLYGVRLTPADMDKIDQKLQKLYFANKA